MHACHLVFLPEVSADFLSLGLQKVTKPLQLTFDAEAGLGWAAWRHPQLARSVSEINDIPADDIRLRAFMKSRLQSPRMMNITGGSEIPLEFLNFDDDFGRPTTLHNGQRLYMYNVSHPSPTVHFTHYITVQHRC